jgi:hypothetical protein
MNAIKIVRLNIEYYRNLLGEERDVKRREEMSRLLAEQEAKLAQLVSEEWTTNNGHN